MSDESVCGIVRKMEHQYVYGSTAISKHVQFNQADNIDKIDAYINSRHTTGDIDSKGREKPFFNIVIAAVNIWFRATDIDRKDIKLKASNSKNAVATFFANIHLQEWMKKINFGTFLNEWGRALAKYGSVVCKFVEKDGTLKAEVIPWNRVICDTIDFDNNVKIEKFFLTPAQLKKNPLYDQDMVANLIESTSTRKLLNKQQVDTMADYIEIYEVHGELPLSFITDKEDDEDTYVQQMHVISFVAKQNNRRKSSSEYDDYTLYKGKEKQDPYMITHLIKEDGRTQSIGAVEYLFDAQWMMNHTVKQIKDQLDLASKLIFQTSDGSFVGRNALNSIETGDILIHNQNEPLTNLANSSHDIASLQNYGQQWNTLAKEITSTPDSISGSTMPSGTAYRQVAVLNQEAHSLFELMTENKGLYLENMVRKYVIPFVQKKMNNNDEIMATLEEYDITKLDSMYVKAEAIRQTNANIKDTVLNGAIGPDGVDTAQPQDMQGAMTDVQDQLKQMGNQRSIATSEVSWKEEFKDVNWDSVEVEITGEQSNKEAIMTTLTTVLQTIAANPSVLQDPTAKMIFGKILGTTGIISPLELQTDKPAPMPVANTPVANPAPTGAEVGGNL